MRPLQSPGKRDAENSSASPLLSPLPSLPLKLSPHSTSLFHNSPTSPAFRLSFPRCPGYLYFHCSLVIFKDWLLPPATPKVLQCVKQVCSANPLAQHVSASGVLNFSLVHFKQDDCFISSQKQSWVESAVFLRARRNSMHVCCCSLLLYCTHSHPKTNWGTCSFWLRMCVCLCATMCLTLWVHVCFYYVSEWLEFVYVCAH